MKGSAKQFVLGKDNFPEWFKEQATKGRVRLNYDDDGVLENVVVYGATKNYTAKPDDVIVMLKTGITVIPHETAVKYGPKVTDKEEK